MKVEHELKIGTCYFGDVQSGIKSFELRKNDRGFEVGHILWLREYDPMKEIYTGESVRKAITYILNGGDFGLMEGYVILGL